MDKVSLGKACYFVLFKVDFLGYIIIYCIRYKSDVFKKKKKIFTHSFLS